MQRNCIFPGRYAPLTYYEDVLEASRNTLMARNPYVKLELKLYNHVKPSNW